MLCSKYSNPKLRFNSINISFVPDSKLQIDLKTKGLDDDKKYAKIFRCTIPTLLSIISDVKGGLFNDELSRSRNRRTYV